MKNNQYRCWKFNAYINIGYYYCVIKVIKNTYLQIKEYSSFLKIDSLTLGTDFLLDCFISRVEATKILSLIKKRKTKLFNMKKGWLLTTLFFYILLKIVGLI